MRRFRSIRSVTAAAGAAAVLLAVHPMAASAADSSPQASRSRLQRDADAVTAAGATGLQVAVLEDGRTTKVRSGVADVRSGRAVPLNGRFRIGSITKTLVSTVVLQLVGEGKLSLDDSVERWLPGVVSGSGGNDGSAITVRYLLQHRSGLPDPLAHGEIPLFTVEDYLANRYKRVEPAHLVSLATKYPPTSTPGTQWQYSNTNYWLAGMLIEAVTGRSWEREVERRIVKPLGLSDTFAPGRVRGIPGPHARGYDRRPDGTLIDVTRQDATWGGAAGALIGTTDDLNRFGSALFGGELLKPAELRELKTVFPVGFEGYDDGLGIMRTTASCGVRYWTKDGGTYGYLSQVAVTDDGSRSVALSVSTHRFFTSLWDPSAMFAATATLLDDAICGRTG